jgi:hypothetical protein
MMITTEVPSEATLICHPETACEAITSIKSFLRWKTKGVLAVSYLVEGAIQDLRIPPYQSTHQGDDLWRHTCFEIFVGAKNDAEYYEFNFSPSGEWAVYEFRDYRDGGLIEDGGVEPTVTVNRKSDSLELRAEVPLERLPGLQLNVSLAVGLSVVVEDNDARIFYWALKHPAGKPDFHHPESFALEIDSPVAGADSIAYTAKS